MTVPGTQSVMDRYFSAMGADEDFSRFFTADVTWLMVDSGEEVRGPGPVRDYLLRLHGRMESGDQQPLVVTDAHAFLEGDRVNVGPGNATGLAYCLVYDVSDDLISAMRCYGTIARLMAADPEAGHQVQSASRLGRGQTRLSTQVGTRQGRSA